jgi:hypothetical protein
MDLSLLFCLSIVPQGVRFDTRTMQESLHSTQQKVHGHHEADEQPHRGRKPGNQGQH